MNKVFTLFLVLYGLTMTSAQSLTVSPSDSLYITTADSSQFSTINGLIFLHNNEPDSIIVRWHLASDTIPTGWSILFCDNNQCYQLPTSPKVSLPIAPGDSIDLHAEFSPACVAGIGTMRIATTIERSSDDSILETHIFTYQANISNACASGINNLNAEPAITVFPNPASQQISISGLTYGHNLDVQIIDLQGRIISAQNILADNLISISVSTLTTGMYLVKITDLQINQATAKRFSKF